MNTIQHFSEGQDIVSLGCRSDVTHHGNLRKLLFSDQLEFICEAHNGLSAKIVEEAGFRGIWASGLSISAQFGVRDNNEASWTQVLENLEFMSDAITIPILLDGDTGYGNFNNMQRLIRKLEQRNIAAVCIEDKLFPKTNSFIKGGAQPLADMQEFCGKIKAGKDAQTDPDFCIIARVEAFICGWGLAEALRRAEAYHQAGADGILIHSALSVPDEILAFKQEWGNRCPVVIVPTKYYATPTDVFRQHGFSMVIWANHMLRTAVAAMQKTARTFKESEHLLSIEDKVAPVSEIFRLQNAAELQEAEDRYLPRGAEDTVRSCWPPPAAMNWGNSPNSNPKRWSKSRARQSSPTSSTPTMRWASRISWWSGGIRKRPSICPTSPISITMTLRKPANCDSLLKASNPGKASATTRSFPTATCCSINIFPNLSVRRTMIASFSSTATGRSRPVMPASAVLPSAHSQFAKGL